MLPSLQPQHHPWGEIAGWRFLDQLQSGEVPTIQGGGRQEERCWAPTQLLKVRVGRIGSGDREKGD